MERRSKSKPWLVMVRWTGIFVLIILAGAVTGIIAEQSLEKWGGLSQPDFIPGNEGSVGAWGPVSLVFPAEMDVSSVERAIRIQPEVQVNYEWSGNRLSILPQTALKTGTVYTLTLQAGSKSQVGSVSRRPVSWTFQVRPASVVYIQREQDGSTGDLERATTGGEKNRLTDTGQRVADFGTARDGEQIVYSVENDQGGADLWKVDRDGKQSGLIVSCGQDRCDQPDWAPDGAFIAYRRSTSGSDADTGGTIWIWEAASRTTKELSNGAKPNGTSPTWALNGHRLAYLDTAAETIHLVDLDGPDLFELPVRSGIMGNWSPDGKKFVYVDVQNTDIHPAYNLYVADLTSGSITPVSIDQKDLLELGSPRYSPDGESITVNARPLAAPMGKQIWWIQPDGKIETITNDVNFIYSAYTWSPAGDWLAFQQFEMGSSHSTPQIVIWQRAEPAGSGQPRVIAENAVQPEWLP
jgi:Tol biopolymer transport system component